MDAVAATTERVERHDRGELRASHRTAEGFLLAEGFIAKPGILLYRKADGSTVRELIPEEELHRQDSLGTLGRKSVTYEHPPAGVDVIPSNVQDFGVGDLDGEVAVVEGGYVKVCMAIRREDAVRAVESGEISELSPGYSCRIDMAPGIHPIFGAYDAVQRDRRYNHVALTMAARGGADIRLRADSADAAQVELTRGPELQPQSGVPMDLTQITEALVTAGIMARTDADTVNKQDAGAGIKAAFDAMLEKFDGLSKERDKLQAKYDELFGAAEAAKSKAEEEAQKDPNEEAEMAKADSAAKLAFFNERLPLVELAKTHKVDAIETLDNSALRKAIVLSVNPKMRQDAADAYYEAAIDMIPATAARADSAPAADAYESLRTDARTDSAKSGIVPSGLAWLNSFKPSSEA